MKKLLVIRDRSKIIYFKNRKVRTPVTLEITDKEVDKLRIALKMADITDFSVESLPSKETSKEIKNNFVVGLEDVGAVIEELDSETSLSEQKTILEKLMNNGEL